MIDYKNRKKLGNEILQKLDAIICFSRLTIVDLEQDKHVLEESYLTIVFKEIEEYCLIVDEKLELLLRDNEE